MSPNTKRPAAYKIYLRSLRECRDWWPNLALIFVFGVIWMPVSLLLPVPLKIVIDNVIGEKSIERRIGYFVPSLLNDQHDLLILSIEMGIVLAALTIAHRIAE